MRRRCSLITALAFAGLLSQTADALPSPEPTPVRASAGGRTVTAYLGDSCLTEPAGPDRLLQRCVDKATPRQPPSPLLGVRRGGSALVLAEERANRVHVWPAYIDREGVRIIGHLRSAQARNRDRTRFRFPLGKVNPRANALVIRLFVDRGVFEAIVGIKVAGAASD